MKNIITILSLIAVFFVISCGQFTENDGESCKDKICTEENQICKIVDKEALCVCKDSYQMENNICEKTPIKCNSDCNTWEECNTEIGKCEVISGSCNKDIDCNNTKFCETTSHKCENKCKNNNECSTGQICNYNGKCTTAFICTDSESCYNNDSSWDETSNPVICLLGECTSKPCRSNLDCFNEKVCNSGLCEQASTCSLISEVKITSITSTISENISKNLKAIALDQNGLILNLNENITWETNNSNIVAIDITGEITGKSLAGVAQISASICNKKSETLNIENFTKPENNKLRVIVLDNSENRLENVNISIGENNNLTNSQGIVLIDNLESLNTITVSKANYNTQTFLSTSEKDIIIYLNKEKSINKSGGIKGEFNFDHPSIVDNGGVLFGFAGSSISGSILDFDFKSLLGVPITREVSIFGNETNVTFGSGIQLTLESDVLSEAYKVVSSEGSKTFWGIGGRSSLMEILSIVDSLTSEEKREDFGEFLTSITPLLKTFNHSISETKNISLCDKVEDINDINNNLDLTELIPDFNSECFLDLNMNLNQALLLSLNIKFPELPIIGTNKTKSVMILASTILENKEVLLLGLAGAKDQVQNNDELDGKIDEISFSYSPQHEHIKNNDSIVLITSSQNQEDKPNKDLLRISSLIKVYKDGIIEENLDLSNQKFLALLEDAEFKNNNISFSAIPGVSLYRIDLKDVNGKVWVIYSPITNIPVENKPSDFTEIQSIIVTAVNIEKDDASISYGELLRINNSNLNDLSKLVKKYSSFEINLIAK